MADVLGLAVKVKKGIIKVNEYLVKKSGNTIIPVGGPLPPEYKTVQDGLWIPENSTVKAVDDGYFTIHPVEGTKVNPTIGAMYAALQGQPQGNDDWYIWLKLDPAKPPISYCIAIPKCPPDDLYELQLNEGCVRIGKHSTSPNITSTPPLPNITSA